MQKLSVKIEIIRYLLPLSAGSASSAVLAEALQSVQYFTEQCKLDFRLHGKWFQITDASTPIRRGFVSTL